MRRRTASDGLTILEVLVIIFVTFLLLVLVFAILFRDRPQFFPRMECASRMRQIGLAIFQYEKDYQCMPNAQWNVYQQIRPYLAPNDGGPEEGDEEVTAVFRCPQDEFVPRRDRWNALSYAPIVDSGYVDGDDDGTADSNFTYCAWSYVRTGYGATGQAAKVWQERDLTQIAPDTAILVEKWDPANRLNLEQETPPGYLLRDYAGDPGNDGSTTAMGTINFTGPPCAGTIKSVGDVGGYAFLAVFAHQAAQDDEPTDLNALVHDGTINLLHVDGSAFAKFLREVTNKSPRHIPIWTRTAD